MFILVWSILWFHHSNKSMIMGCPYKHLEKSRHLVAAFWEWVIFLIKFPSWEKAHREAHVIVMSFEFSIVGAWGLLGIGHLDLKADGSCPFSKNQGFFNGSRPLCKPERPKRQAQNHLKSLQSIDSNPLSRTYLKISSSQ